MFPTQLKILSLFALSCALTWAGNVGNLLWPAPVWPVPMNPLGPLIAAPIVIWLTASRAGLVEWWQRITAFRAPPRIYAIAFMVPLAIIFAAFVLTAMLGARIEPLRLPHWGEILLTSIVVVLLFGPMEEELSFRGYGLFELERTMSPLAASLWIGFGVMVWHAPLLISGELPWTVLLPLSGVSIVYGWLRTAGGSLWPLVILHGQLNVVANLITGPMMPERADQAIYLAILGLFYIAWAVLIVRRLGPSLAGRNAQPGLPMPI